MSVMLGRLNTAESLVPDPSRLEVEIAIEKLKKPLFDHLQA
jgi:hypothetical protein